MREKSVTIRFAAVAISLTLSFAVTGCSWDSGRQTSGECQAQVRDDGIVYTSFGYTERNARKHASAERTDCHDVGKDAAGSVFPEEPQHVTTWSFRGYSPEEVVGVRFDKDTFAVFVADSAPDAARERIYRELD